MHNGIRIELNLYGGRMLHYMELNEKNFTKVLKFIGHHWYSKYGIFKDGDNLHHVFKDAINILENNDIQVVRKQQGEDVSNDNNTM